MLRFIPGEHTTNNTAHSEVADTTADNPGVIAVFYRCGIRNLSYNTADGVRAEDLTAIVAVPNGADTGGTDTADLIISTDSRSIIAVKDGSAVAAHYAACRIIGNNVGIQKSQIFHSAVVLANKCVAMDVVIFIVRNIKAGDGFSVAVENAGIGGSLGAILRGFIKTYGRPVTEAVSSAV